MKSVFTIESPIIYNVHSSIVFSTYIQKLSTRSQCSWFLLTIALLHPAFHSLDALVTLGDRLPARTRMDLRELVQQEIVQSLKQDHFEGPSRIVEALDQIIPDPREKLLGQHLAHHPLLPPPTHKTVLLRVHRETILINKTVDADLSEGYSPEASQMRQIHAPLGQWPHEIHIQSCTFLRTVHVHIVESVHINRVCQGSQPTIHHSHSWVHHFEKSDTQSTTTRKHRARQ